MNCFLCHSSNDIELVKPHEKMLKDNGLTTWLAERDIRNKTDLEISNSVAACGCFVAFVTPNLIKCQYCADEISLARRRGKAFFPVFLQDSELEDVADIFVSGKKWYGVEDDGFKEALIYDLKHALGIPVVGEPPILIHKRNIAKKDDDEEEEEGANGGSNDKKA